MARRFVVVLVGRRHPLWGVRVTSLQSFEHLREHSSCAAEPATGVDRAGPHRFGTPARWPVDGAGPPVHPARPYRFAAVPGSPPVLHIARCRSLAERPPDAVVVFFDATDPGDAYVQHAAAGLDLSAGVCLTGRWRDLVPDQVCPIPSRVAWS